MEREYFEIWSGNDAYRADELQSQWKPTDTGEDSFESFYEGASRQRSATLGKLEDKTGRYTIAFRSDTGKIVRFRTVTMKTETDGRTSKDVYPTLLAMKEKSSGLELLRQMCEVLNTRDVVYHMKENTKEIKSTLGHNLSGMGSYGHAKDIARFAWLSGINLQDCEMILLMDCFDNNTHSPVLIDRSTMKYVEEVCSFGLGHFKWGDGTKRINSPLEQKDGSLYRTEHTLTFPNLSLGKTESDVALSDVYEITDEENEQMSKIIQEAI